MQGLSRFWKNHYLAARYRSSSPEMFCKKGVLRNFEKFTGKHLCESLFFNKVTGCGLAVACLPVVFSCEFCEISENIFSWRTPLVAASGDKLKTFKNRLIQTPTLIVTPPKFPRSTNRKELTQLTKWNRENILDFSIVVITLDKTSKSLPFFYQRFVPIELVLESLIWVASLKGKPLF